MIESQVFEQNDEFSFDIVDLGDILEVAGMTLPGLLFTSKGYAREQTAERNAAKWIADYDKADEPKRRRLCGFDTIAQCRLPEREVRKVRRRISAGSR